MLSIDGILARSGSPNPVFYAEACRSADMIPTYLGREGSELATMSKGALNEMLNSASAVQIQQANLQSLASSVQLPISGLACQDVPMVDLPNSPGSVPMVAQAKGPDGLERT